MENVTSTERADSIETTCADYFELMKQLGHVETMRPFSRDERNERLNAVRFVEPGQQAKSLMPLS